MDRPASSFFLFLLDISSVVRCGRSALLRAALRCLKVDLREAIALMQSYGDVGDAKHQQAFPQHRSTNSGRIAPSLTSTTKPVAGCSGHSSSGSAVADTPAAAAAAAFKDTPKTTQRSKETSKTN